MDLSSITLNGATVVSVNEPRIDAACAIQFKDSFREKARDTDGNIILDLAKVEFIDSSGLGAVVASMKLLTDDRKLILTGLDGAVQKVFTLTRMDTIFLIYDTVEDAVAKEAA